ncbi:putative Pumilio [Fusarium oxysporum f. sp. albedinis]|nr:putative Pumilio [Fusarium oxysporum f. sp. albedinis]
MLNNINAVKAVFTECHDATRKQNRIDRRRQNIQLITCKASNVSARINILPHSQSPLPFLTLSADHPPVTGFTCAHDQATDRQATASKYLSSHGKTRRTKRGLCFRRWDHTPRLSDFRRSVKLVCDFWIEADQCEKERTKMRPWMICISGSAIDGSIRRGGVRDTRGGHHAGPPPDTRTLLCRGIQAEHVKMNIQHWSYKPSTSYDSLLHIPYLHIETSSISSHRLCTSHFRFFSVHLFLQSPITSFLFRSRSRSSTRKAVVGHTATPPIE